MVSNGIHVFKETVKHNVLTFTDDIDERFEKKISRDKQQFQEYIDKLLEWSENGICNTTFEKCMLCYVCYDIVGIFI